MKSLPLNHPALLASLVFLWLAPPSAWTQAQGDAADDANTRSNFPLWSAELPGGSYLVSLADVSSISTHEYLVDGAARVTEVTISGAGPVVARFYYLEPATPTSPLGLGQSTINAAQEKVEQAVDRAGAGDVWRKVIKNYPLTTHAHTVEYRLASLDELNSLFQSLERAWKRRRSEVFKLKE